MVARRLPLVFFSIVLVIGATVWALSYTDIELPAAGAGRPPRGAETHTGRLEPVGQTTRKTLPQHARASADPWARGRIVDEQTGQPVAGCRYRGVGSPLEGAPATDADGAWKLPMPPGGSALRVVFTPEENVSVRYDVARPVEPVTLTFPHIAQLDVRCAGVPEGATWSCTVLPVQPRTGLISTLESPFPENGPQGRVSVSGVTRRAGTAEPVLFRGWQGVEYDVVVSVAGHRTDATNRRVRLPNVVEARVLGETGSFRVVVEREDGRRDDRSGWVMLRSGESLVAHSHLDTGACTLDRRLLGDGLRVLVRMEDGELFATEPDLAKVRASGTVVFRAGSGAPPVRLRSDRDLVAAVFSDAAGRRVVLTKTRFASLHGEGMSGVRDSDGCFALQPGPGQWSRFAVLADDGAWAQHDVSDATISAVFSPTRIVRVPLSAWWSVPDEAEVHWLLESSVPGLDASPGGLCWVTLASGTLPPKQERVLGSSQTLRGSSYRVRGSYSVGGRVQPLPDITLPSDRDDWTRRQGRRRRPCRHQGQNGARHRRAE